MGETAIRPPLARRARAFVGRLLGAGAALIVVWLLLLVITLTVDGHPAPTQPAPSSSCPTSYQQAGDRAAVGCEGVVGR